MTNYFRNIPTELVRLIAKKCIYSDTLNLNMTCHYMYQDINLKLLFRKLKNLARLYILANNKNKKIKTDKSIDDILEILLQYKSVDKLTFYFANEKNRNSNLISGKYILLHIKTLNIINAWNKGYHQVNLKKIFTIFPNLHNLSLTIFENIGPDNKKFKKFNIQDVCVSFLRCLKIYNGCSDLNLSFLLQSKPIDGHIYYHFDNLKKLRIEWSDISNDHLLNTLRTLTNLTKLTLIGCNNIKYIHNIFLSKLKMCNSPLVIHLSNLTNLKLLYLENGTSATYDFNPQCVVNLSDLRNLIKLYSRN